MKKVLAGLLLSLVLLLPAGTAAYAADNELTYSEYVDEVAGMEKPYWSFDYYPELSYEHKFLWFEWGEADTVSWNIDTVTYYFTMVNEHKGGFNVGYNPSDINITFNFTYSSMDDSMKEYTSNGSVSYSLSDLDTGNGYMEFVFPYEEVLSHSEYYGQGYKTVLTSAYVTVSSKVTNKRGTVSFYEFDCDDDYVKQIYTGIDFYLMTDDEKRLVSTQAASYKGDDDGTGDGNGGNIEKHHYVVVYPDSMQEVTFSLNDVLTAIFVDLPRAMLNVVQFLFNFIVMLPEYIHMVVPFLPEYLIAAIMFVIVLGIVWGVVEWIKSLKGD